MRSRAHIMARGASSLLRRLRSKSTTTPGSFASALPVRKMHKRTRPLLNTPERPIRGPRPAAAAQTSFQTLTRRAWALVCPRCTVRKSRAPERALRDSRGRDFVSCADDGDFDGTTGRADGVAVYLKHAAATILEALFGAERIYGEGFTSWSEKQLSYTAKATSTIKSPTAEAQMGTMHRLCKEKDATQAMPPHVDSPVSPAAPIHQCGCQIIAACRAVSPFGVRPR